MKKNLRNLTINLINLTNDYSPYEFMRLIIVNYMMKYTNKSYKETASNNYFDKYCTNKDEVISKKFSCKFDFLRQQDPLSIGWVYQYYQMEKKSKNLESFNSKNIKEEDIPKETQAFTPDWITSYLLSNTLGNIWLSNTNDTNSNDFLYYINTKKQVKKENFNLEEIKILDPCMGCGHILSKAFDMLFPMYIKLGYEKEKIPELILRNNLYGIDIDSLACFITKTILLLKSFEYDCEIFSKDISFNLIYMIDVNSCKENCSLKNLFINAKTFGSIININEEVNVCNDCIYKKQYEMLRMKYDIVVTNPPYLGRKGLNKEMKEYLKKNYELGKTELYSAFILRCCSFLKDDGLLGMITIHTFMFISSFKKFRKHLISKYTFISMLHTGAATFDDLNSFNVLSTAFILSKKENIESVFIRLADIYNSKDKILGLNNPANYFYLNEDIFLEIPNYAFIYWLDDKCLRILSKCTRLGDLYTIRAGMQTSNNEYYLRYWFEVPKSNISFNLNNIEEHFLSGKLYVPYNKGGNYRKWYGNNEFVIKFDKKHYDILAVTGNLLPSRNLYFKKGLTWNLFGFENFGVRYKDKGFVFDISGSSMFLPEEDIYYVLGYLSSNVAFYFLSTLNPTVNFQVGNIKDLPLIKNDKYIEEINHLVKENIEISKKDYDYSIASWDYEYSPLIKYNQDYISKALCLYHDELLNNYNIIKNNERILNSIFCKIYDINISCEVREKDIVLNKENISKEINELILYVIGIIFGRYKINGYEFKYNLLTLKELEKEFYCVIKLLFKGDINENIGFICKNKSLDDLIIQGLQYQKKVFNNLPIYWFFKVNKETFILYYHFNINVVNNDSKRYMNNIIINNVIEFVKKVNFDDGIRDNLQQLEKIIRTN